MSDHLPDPFDELFAAARIALIIVFGAGVVLAVTTLALVLT